MIEVDFAQQQTRTVKVETETESPDGRCRNTLSGFLVADGLVLTCAHNVAGAETVRVERADTGQVYDGEITWPIPDLDETGTEPVDVALIRVEGLRAPRGQRLVWGELAGVVGAVDSYCMGFPRAARDPEQYHLTPVTGSFFPGEGATRNRMVFTVSSALPEASADWAGMSGAMVRDGDGYLLGIAAELPEAWHGRFFVVPAELILAQPRLSGLLGAPELHAISSEHPLLKPAFEPMGEETDFKLITARYGQVPFVEESHGETLDDLVEWCEDSDRPAAVRILLGPGGSGKTRVAAELCRRLQESELHWTAGFAREDETASWESFNPQRPTLVVFDYVERPTIASKVATLLSRLDRLGPALQARVRILLVSRSTANWYAQVDDVGRGVLSRRLRAEGEHAKVVLADRPFDAELRRRHFVSAFERFAPDTRDAEAYFESIDDAQYDSPLLVHIAALLAARDGGVPFAGPNRLRETLLGYLIARERNRRWKSEPGLSTTVIGPELSDQALHVVAIMTLTTPTVPEAEELLKCSRLWEDQPNAVRREAARAAMRLYPGPDPGQGQARRAAPIEPDLISEHLLMGVEDLGTLLERMAGSGFAAHHTTRLLHILSLSCDHYAAAKPHFLQALKRAIGWAADSRPLAPEAEALMADLLGQSLGLLLDTAVKQANEDGDGRAAQTLTGALKAVSGVQVVEATVANSELEQCRGHSSLVRLREALYALAVEHCRRTHEVHSLLSCLEGWLDTRLELGEADSALEIFQDIQGLRGDTDRLADPPRLDRLLELLIRKRIWDQAETVFWLARDLRASAEAETAVREWGLPLAERIQRGCLGNEMLDEAFSLAQWSIEQLSGHSDATADSYAASVDLLMKLSQRFLDGSQPRKALNAGVSAIRVLHRQPDLDPSAHPLVLGTTETALDQLREPGDFGEWVEHERLLLDIRRELVKREGEPRSVDAEAFERAGNLLWEAGDRDEAIQSLMSARDIRRRLCGPGDKASRLRLMAVLDDLRSALSAAEIEQELRGTLIEQVQLWSSLGELDDDLAIGEAVALERLDLHNWHTGTVTDPRSLTGIIDAALVRVDRFTRGRRDFASIEIDYPSQPTKFGRIGRRQPDPAVSGRIRILRDLARELPEAESLLALTLTEHAKTLERRGRNSAALRTVEEAWNIHRRISSNNGSTYMMQRLETEGILCRLTAVSSFSDLNAERAGRHAVKTARKLSDKDSRFEPVLAQVLLDHSTLLESAGKNSSAISEATEAINTYETLAGQDRSYTVELARSRVTLAKYLRPRDGVEFAQKAVDEVRELAEADASFRPALAESLRGLGTIWRRVGTISKAKRCEQEAAAVEAKLAASDQAE